LIPLQGSITDYYGVKVVLPLVDENSTKTEYPFEIYDKGYTLLSNKMEEGTHYLCPDGNLLFCREGDSITSDKVTVNRQLAKKLKAAKQFPI